MLKTHRSRQNLPHEVGVSPLALSPYPTRALGYRVWSLIGPPLVKDRAGAGAGLGFQLLYSMLPNSGSRADFPKKLQNVT